MVDLDHLAITALVADVADTTGGRGVDGGIGGVGDIDAIVVSGDAQYGVMAAPKNRRDRAFGRQVLHNARIHCRKIGQCKGPKC
jgi:hypothetical protein